MMRNVDGFPQCQTCLQRFSNDQKLREHIEAFKSRLQHLIAELQKCYEHIVPKPSDDVNCEVSDDSDTDDLVNDECYGQPTYLCPHNECKGKPKTPFATWKDFVRHYTIHIPCRERCGFCGRTIERVRKYVTHIDSCKKRNEAKASSDYSSKNIIAIERKRILRTRASNMLKDAISTTTNTPENSRKRTLAIVDPDSDSHSEVLSKIQKRLTEGADGVDAVAANPDTSYQALDTEGVGGEMVIPASVSLDGAIVPTQHTAQTLLPLHVENSIITSANDGTFSAYSDGSNGTFMANDYRRAFPRAPIVFSHTMDGFSSFLERGYEATTHTSAPMTLDGSPIISAEHQYEARVHARAPLCTSLPMDGHSSYAAAGSYDAPAQSRMLLAGYDLVDAHQSNTHFTDEEVRAFLGTSQSIGHLAPVTTGNE